MNNTAGRTAEPPELPGLLYIAPLGSGGYSNVYLYEQQMPRMKVAVKVLSAQNLSEQAQRQFSAEANAMAQLADHPHIVQVFRADMAADGRPFLVMKYYPQPNLAQRARGERFSVPDVLRIGIQIASAVEAAHRIGILHRDIKPANILTGQYGTLGLTDFGIAATKAEAASGQTDGISIPWAPPEVLFSAEHADERSDVYSVAATLWHLLVGRSPFDLRGGDNTAVALMHRITSTPAPPTGRGDVPPSFERLLHSALAKDPAARPATALAFARALQAVEQEQRLPLTTIVVADDPRRTASTLRPANAPSDEDGTRINQPMRVEGADHREPRPLRGLPHELDDDPTRRKQPTRIDAQGGTAPVLPPWQSPQTRAYPQASPDQYPPPGPPPPPRPTASPIRSRRTWYIVAAAACAAGAIALVVALSSGGKHPAKDVTPTDGTQIVLPSGPDAQAPGTPKVTAARAAGGKIKFQWTYDGKASGDSYRWRESGGTRSGVAPQPQLELSVPSGGQVCLQVQVFRNDGSFASSWSDPKCAG
ncbi:MAG TPA: serine/threonine-protein kinase [Pseudonocardia sp.]|nr:serine/threonine-protein kinase [Pseudonocardia sp.]